MTSLCGRQVFQQPVRSPPFCRSGVSRDPKRRSFASNPHGIPIRVFPGPRCKPRTNWIHDDVSRRIDHRFFVAQCSVVKSGGPYWQSIIMVDPCMARRVGFQASDKPRQGLPLSQSHDAMPVIRHKDPCKKAGLPPEALIDERLAGTRGHIVIEEDWGTIMRCERDQVDDAGQGDAPFSQYRVAADVRVMHTHELSWVCVGAVSGNSVSRGGRMRVAAYAAPTGRQCKPRPAYSM